MSSISIGLVSRNEPHATAVRGGGSAPAATPMSNGSAGKPVTASRSATTGQSANRNLTRVTPAASATPPRTTTRVPFACPESTETAAAGVHVPSEQSSNLAAVGVQTGNLLTAVLLRYLPTRMERCSCR